MRCGPVSGWLPGFTGSTATLGSRWTPPPKNTAALDIAFCVAKGKHADMLAKFNAALNEVLKLPEIVERLAAIGCVPVTGSPEDLRALATREAAFYAEAARLAKYQPE